MSLLIHLYMCAPHGGSMNLVTLQSSQPVTTPSTMAPQQQPTTNQFGAPPPAYQHFGGLGGYGQYGPPGPPHQQPPPQQYPGAQPPAPPQSGM